MIYLTPTSISYLNQLVLIFVITAYLGWRFFLQKTLHHSTTDRWLMLFSASLTVFLLAVFLQVSVLPSERLVVVYTLNLILAMVLMTLLQFAYVFPQPSEKQKLERWIALIVTNAYIILEVGVAVWRFSLLEQGHVVYRPPTLEYVPVVLFIWTIFVFGRGTVQNWHNLANRRFALIALIPAGLTVLNQRFSFHYGSTPFYHINLSIGILVSIFLFALNYLASQPETTSLMVKFSGGILTVVLAVFGMAAWLVTPAYVAQYRAPVLDHRSLRFTPNHMGGYDVSEIPFRFDGALGENLHLTDYSAVPPGYYEAAFAFPFYSQKYSTVVITNNGLLTFGQPVSYYDFEYRLSKAPAFFALGLDLNPEHGQDFTNPEVGVFLHREPDQLVITYRALRAYYYPDRKYTFQIVLYHDGRIDLTFNGLPSGPQYQIYDRYDASIWMIGAKPGEASGQPVSFAHLPLMTGPQGALDDQYRAFRQAVDTFLTPLALAILVSSLLFLFGLPLTLNLAMARPLRRLLAGVERFNAGKNHQPIPIQFNDEVGFLTQSFNTLTGELDNLIQTLETRAAARTADLLAANAELRKLTLAVEQSPASIVITDLDGKIEYVNPRFTQVTGYTFEEAIGNNPRILKTDQTPPEMHRQLWEAITTGKEWHGEFVNQKKDGSLYYESATISPITDGHGCITHYLAVKEDVTQRKQSEEALKNSEMLYRLLAENIADVIWILDLQNGAFRYISPSVERLRGYTAEEVFAQGMGMALTPDSLQSLQQNLPSRLEAYQQGHQGYYVDELEQPCKDGTTIWTETTTSFQLNETNGHLEVYGVSRDITERKAAERELERLATTDPLTGLLNRRSFFAEAEKIFARSLHPPYDLVVLMLDIDHFKSVNDQYGHQTGDNVLQEVAARLVENLRPTDILARYGGEEFVALLPRLPLATLPPLAARLNAVIREKTFHHDGTTLAVTISIGAAILTQSSTLLDELLSQADQALYQAKETGRDKAVIWHETA